MTSLFMYQPDFYKGLEEEKIAESVKAEGFNPIRFSNATGDSYSPHKHPETKLLAFLKGNLEVKVGGEDFQCKAGDKLVVPGNTLHSSVAGPEGCEFFWSEKLL
ncbi:MAG: AraC family ligand binding domain-containing protein [Candidatus Woykebacteria bacterium]